LRIHFSPASAEHRSEGSQVRVFVEKPKLSLLRRFATLHCLHVLSFEILGYDNDILLALTFPDGGHACWTIETLTSLAKRVNEEMRADEEALNDGKIKESYQIIDTREVE
jgi:hypothetical protein